MTTSLKDEIKTYLGFLEHYDYHEEEIENRTNDIIKIFEKRIDSIRLPQIEENRTYTKSDLEYLAVCIMEDVKTEMLK